MRRTAPLASAVSVVLLAVLVQAQGTPPPTPLSLISSDGRRQVPTTIVNGQELIALDDVAALFQVTVREDALAGGVTVSYRGQTIVISADQSMASVAGRVVALPSAPVRSGQRWLVPVEFLSRALAPIYDARIDLRRPSRLLIVGDVQVPRVTARIDAAGPPTRATIEIAPAAPVTVTTEAGRIVARIDAVALDLGLPGGGAGLISEIRGADEPTSIAVLLNSGAGATRAVPAEADGVTRIAIEVASSSPDTAAAPAPAAPAPEATLPLLTSPRPALVAIVIDPGHGGADAGVRGAGGTVEKDITLQVARRLRALVETRLGIRVILTRDDDRDLNLDERAAVANNNKADLFLSLHVNASPAPSVRGAEVFRLRLDREGEAARQAAREAVALPVLGGRSRVIDVIRWDLAQARHLDASTTFAALLQESLRGQVTMGARPLQEAPLRVLTSVDMPAALIEMAYLTSPDDERMARSEAFQNAVAQGIYSAILRFRGYLDEQDAP